MNSTIPDIDELQPLGSSDEECLRDLRGVLEQYGALNRFGVHLLHDHFTLEPGEQLVETPNLEERTLIIRPERLSSETGRTLQTNWRFGPGPDVIAALVCRVGCFVDLKDRHKTTHQRVNRP
jgi:hypothetical protein